MRLAVRPPYEAQFGSGVGNLLEGVILSVAVFQAEREPAPSGIARGSRAETEPVPAPSDQEGIPSFLKKHFFQPRTATCRGGPYISRTQSRFQIEDFRLRILQRLFCDDRSSAGLEICNNLQSTIFILKSLL